MSNEFPHITCVIDGDQIILDLLRKSLYASGAGLVKCYRDGGAALNTFKVQKDFQLIILDWKLKDMKAIALFQALRADPKNVYLPIIITSGLISKEDFSALREFPCVELLEKPFTKAVLDKAVIKVWKESLWYKENHNQVKKLFNEVLSGDKNAVTKYVDIISSCKKPQPLILAASRHLREVGHNEVAAKLLVDGLNKFKGDPSLMGELGKIHFMNGDLVSAKQCIENALVSNPQNIERLIFAGEVDLNLHEYKEAKEHFEKALALDPNEPYAQTGVKIAAGSHDKLTTELTKSSATKNMAGLLNMLGISLIRDGEYEKGFEQYKLALGLLNTDLETQKIYFNLSLGHLRAKMYSEASEFLEKAIKYGGILAKKSKIYLERVESYKASKAVSGNKVDADDIFGDIDDLELLGGEDDDLDFGSNSYGVDLSGLEDDFFSLPKKKA